MEQKINGKAAASIERLDFKVKCFPFTARVQHIYTGKPCNVLQKRNLSMVLASRAQHTKSSSFILMRRDFRAIFAPFHDYRRNHRLANEKKILFLMCAPLVTPVLSCVLFTVCVCVHDFMLANFFLVDFVVSDSSFFFFLSRFSLIYSFCLRTQCRKCRRWYCRRRIVENATCWIEILDNRRNNININTYKTSTHE